MGNQKIINLTEYKAKKAKPWIQHEIEIPKQVQSSGFRYVRPLVHPIMGVTRWEGTNNIEDLNGWKGIKTH